MTRSITKAEARAFRRRWVAVEEVVRNELRSLPVGDKLKQLNALMALARRFGWNKPRTDGVAEVRRRWNRLFRAYRG